ncbi:MAG: DUF4258 domain-containing protein [Patescibacteria group bacterium]
MSVIFTNHANDRIRERSFDKKVVIETVEKPDSVGSGKQKGTLEYIKKYGISRVTVIVKENEKREKIVLSCWIDPPMPGTKDAKRRARYLKYQKATILERVVMDILSIFGL